MPSRRRFLGVASGTIAAAALSRLPRAWQVPRYDLIVTGGTVIDPSQGISGVRDIGIVDGRIARVADTIPADQGTTLVDARGKLVTPGLIDIHVHVFEGVARYGIDPDLVGVARGVTTLVDGGSAGAITFPGFRAYIVEPARTRVHALLNIAESGMVVANETADLSGLDVDAAVRTVNENRDVIVGIKVRMLAGIPDGQDLEVMRRARAAADAAGVPIMVHIGGQRSPLPRIVDLLRQGDVITHALRRSGSILDGNGLVHPAVREAIARGVQLDVGHGRGNLDFDVAEAVLAQGIAPTVISSDVHRGNALGPVFDLPTTLSKFMTLGMSLEDVVRAASVTPARIFDFGDELGTLRPGAVADVAILEPAQGPVEFVDSGGKTRHGQQRLVPYGAIMGGRAFGSINS